MNGDVVFVVGAEKRQVRVHSVIARSASKVFDAMLGPHFSEGKKMGESQPAKIHLPEDDSIAMSIIFCVLHGQNDGVPTILGTRQVLEIAITTDKYDMCGAMKFAAKCWLDPVSIADTQGLWHLMTAAYTFGDAERFEDITLRLILDHSGSYLSLLLEDNSIYSEVFVKICC